MHQVFNHPTSNSFKSYKTYNSALKHVTNVIGDVEEANIKDKLHFRFLIIALEDGRFKPLVLLESGIQASFLHYLIDKNCAVQII